jgi:pyruvate-formate lyase-activating enzyme
VSLYWEKTLMIFIFILKKGIHISFESNMYYIPWGFIDLIKEYPLDEFNISIYGVDDIHINMIAGSNNDCRKVLENLEILIKHGIKFKLRTPVSKSVIPVLVDLKDYQILLKFHISRS